MRELALVFGLCLLMAAFGLVVIFDPERVMIFAKALMLRSLFVALPFELFYFLGLAVVLRRDGAPHGWYWRSFEHHHRLGRRERWLVLSFFAIGSVAMVAATLGVVIVLAAGVTALRQ